MTVGEVVGVNVGVTLGVGVGVTKAVGLEAIPLTAVPKTVKAESVITVQLTKLLE